MTYLPTHHRQRPCRLSLRAARLCLPSAKLPAAEAAPEATDEPRKPDILTLFAPSSSYILPKSPVPDVEISLTLAHTGSTFITKPPSHLFSPRFLLFVAVSDYYVDEICPKMRIEINGAKITRVIGDTTPTDATEFLAPFGSKNSVIVDVPDTPSKFTIELVGIWSSYFTMDQLMQRIWHKNRFQPAKMMKVERGIAGKGKFCRHDECFDIVRYVTVAQALNEWKCPICGEVVPFWELAVASIV